MQTLDRKKIASFCIYDFANSSYSAVIAAVIFPVYYTSFIVGNETGLGDLWWGRAISLSMIIVAISGPLLGGLADYSGLRKRFLLSFTLLCVTSVSLLGFIDKGMALEGFILVVIANIGFEGGLVFYNSFLPQIAPREYHGRVSSWGFGVGYMGSILSLLIALPLVKAKMFWATWVMVGGFFLVFSLPALVFLPKDERKGSIVHAAGRGFTYTWETFRGILRNRNAFRFLLAYLFYEDGVNTVIIFSSIFAAKTLGFATGELIFLYIVVQIFALAGAFSMAGRTDRWGPKKVVSISLVLWTAVCVMAYFVESKSHFWAVASIAGLGLGTVQAASRALYARFIPEGHESEYFGVYSMMGKTSAVIGPLVFGEVSASMGSQRPAILSVAAFFIIGFVMLRFVRDGEP